MAIYFSQYGKVSNSSLPVLVAAICTA